MNSKQIINELKQKYPGCRIILLPKENPTEIICEIDPATKHPNYSVAISVLEKSTPHYHKIVTEDYEVIKGKVLLFLDNKKLTLKTGDKQTIKPGIVHWAQSDSGWIECTSKPGWTPEDHIIA